MLKENVRRHTIIYLAPEKGAFIGPQKRRIYQYLVSYFVGRIKPTTIIN